MPGTHGISTDEFDATFTFDSLLY